MSDIEYLKEFKEIFYKENVYFPYLDVAIFMNTKFFVTALNSGYVIGKFPKEFNEIPFESDSIFRNITYKKVRVHQILNDQELPNGLRKIILFNLNKFM